MHCILIYKPLPFLSTSLVVNEPENYRDKNTKIVIGDLNSRNVTWGYTENNKDGENVEDRAETGMIWA